MYNIIVVRYGSVEMSPVAGAVYVSSPIALTGHDLFDFLDASVSLLSIVDRLHAHTIALQTSLILTK